VSTAVTAKHESTVPAPATTAGAASPRIASTLSSPGATPNAEPTAALAPKPAPKLMPAVMTVVTRLASQVVNAILSPFAASNTPGTPAETPMLWSLLAFARREFENAFTAPSLTDTPVDAATTSATLADPEQRTLVLTALPVEANDILARTTLDSNPNVVVDGRHFYLGTLGGKPVIVGMTGIGEVNASQTTEIALEGFTPASGISIDAVVFDGVAGGSGRTEIGDVAVPARWTSDDGATWHAVDPSMLAAANTVTVNLDSTGSIGDPACVLCGPLASLPLINLNREPQLFVGGDGATNDNNNGVAFPEIPFGGAIFGPEPLAAPDFSPLYFGNFFQALGPFLAQGLLSNITGFFTAANPPVDAVDQETAAAQQVADAHGIPFLGIRGMSDGPGDPLPLPGYPFTLLVFKQIAADNAAIVTEAFLTSWAGP
jgi:nucleoside phosphorylase